MKQNTCTPVGIPIASEAAEKNHDERRQPRCEHVVGPTDRSSESRCRSRRARSTCSRDRRPREGRHDHRDERHRRQEDDVDLGVTEHRTGAARARITAAGRVENGQWEGPLDRGSSDPAMTAGTRTGSSPRHEDVPGVERHQVQSHPGGRHLRVPTIISTGRRDRRHLDERNPSSQMSGPMPAV